MKHSAMNRRLMVDWMRDCDDDGSPMPTDAEIARRFRFDSEELSRSLLADLADARSIVLTGCGPSRTIALPGAVRAVEPAGVRGDKLPPTVRKGDPAVDHVAALIVTLNEQAGRLSRPASAVPAPLPAPVRWAEPVPKEKAMAKQPTAQMMPPLTIDDLAREAAQLVLKIERFKLSQQARPAQRPEDAAAIAALTARAEAAEGKLATLKAALAA